VNVPIHRPSPGGRQCSAHMRLRLPGSATAPPREVGIPCSGANGGANPSAGICPRNPAFQTPSVVSKSPPTVFTLTHINLTNTHTEATLCTPFPAKSKPTLDEILAKCVNSQGAAAAHGRNTSTKALHSSQFTYLVKDRLRN